MTNLQPDNDSQTSHPSRFNSLQLSAIVLLAILITVALTFFTAKAYLFPSELEPVKLNSLEKTQLDRKLRRLGWQRDTAAIKDDASLQAKPYTESDEDREIRLTEKELNGLISQDPQLARRIAIDLDEDLASANILIPIPKDFPVMAGQVLRVTAGVELRIDDSRKPVVAIRGVNLMGVPIPNAWLGNIKNVDLVSEYGNQGFWKSFSEGVDDIEVRNGEIYIKLRE